jgi:acetolactate synthase-1/2/3 large subunit
MTAFEVATAVAEHLPLRVFVFNDGHLGMVEKGHAKVYGRHAEYPTGTLDVCAIASGLSGASPGWWPWAGMCGGSTRGLSS